MASAVSGEDLMNSQNVLQSNESVYKSTCHNEPSDIEVRQRDKKKLIMTSIICLIFMIAEIVGGYLANSLAIASDAGHLFTDFSAFMVSLAAIVISSKPQTRRMSFGFQRAEVLGALISVLAIWLVTGILDYIAVQRLINFDFEIDSAVMMYVSLGGIAANIVMGLSLAYYKQDSMTKSINVRSALIHVLGDLIQSFGVFVASLIIYFKPELKVVDPVCTFVFSVIVLFTTINILRDIVQVLMEGFPKNMSFSYVKQAFYSIPGIVEIHSLRIWSLTLDKAALSAHIVVEKGVNAAEVLRQSSEIIHRDLNIYEVTLQIEEQGDKACSVCA